LTVCLQIAASVPNDRLVKSLLPILFLASAFNMAFAQQKLPPVQYTEIGVPACPTDLDLRNLDVRLSAVLHHPDNAHSVRVEQGRAVSCRTAGARYTEQDWKRLRAVLRGER
jgi:hypothetical protein